MKFYCDARHVNVITRHSCDDYNSFEFLSNRMQLVLSLLQLVKQQLFCSNRLFISSTMTFLNTFARLTAGFSSGIVRRKVSLISKQSAFFSFWSRRWKCLTISAASGIVLCVSDTRKKLPPAPFENCLRCVQAFFTRLFLHIIQSFSENHLPR